MKRGTILKALILVVGLVLASTLIRRYLQERSLRALTEHSSRFLETNTFSDGADQLITFNAGTVKINDMWSRWRYRVTGDQVMVTAANQSYDKSDPRTQCFGGRDTLCRVEKDALRVFGESTNQSLCLRPLSDHDMYLRLGRREANTAVMLREVENFWHAARAFREDLAAVLNIVAEGIQHIDYTACRTTNAPGVDVICPTEDNGLSPRTERWCYTGHISTRSSNVEWSSVTNHPLVVSGGISIGISTSSSAGFYGSPVITCGMTSSFVTNAIVIVDPTAIGHLVDRTKTKRVLYWRISHSKVGEYFGLMPSSAFSATVDACVLEWPGPKVVASLSVTAQPPSVVEVPIGQPSDDYLDRNSTRQACAMLAKWIRSGSSQISERELMAHLGGRVRSHHEPNKTVYREANSEAQQSVAGYVASRRS